MPVPRMHAGFVPADDPAVMTPPSSDPVGESAREETGDGLDGRARVRRCRVERALDAQVVGDAEQELYGGSLVGAAIAVGILAVPLGEMSVVVKHRRRHD